MRINKRPIIRYATILFIVLFSKAIDGFAQNYHALNGSSYAGSLGVHNNPASIVNTPYKWDLALFGAQLKSSTNIVTIYDYSLLSNPQKSVYKLNEGSYERYGKLSFNFNLLNARIALGRRQAIAFGANVKSYTNVTTSPFNYIDTMKVSGDFFRINQPNTELSARIRSSSWMELYGTYGRTILDNETRRLNAGATIKLNRGLSGASAELRNASFTVTGTNQYSINSIVLQYLYSANYDKISKNKSSSSNFGDFVRYTNGGISLDAGVEYLIRDPGVPDFNTEDDYYDYTWKLGASILDAGFTNYKTSLQVRQLNGIKAGVTNTSLDNTFDSTVTSLPIFNDSLETIASSLAVPYGTFNIINPMRLVLNADRYIQGHFFINAELTINMAGIFKKYLAVEEMNLLVVTPRWETRRWGVYLPMQYTTTNKFWIGGAFKAGPLVFGVHNWANIFSSSKIHQGGGYITLQIRAPQNASVKYDKRLNCPTF